MEKVRDKVFADHSFSEDARLLFAMAEVIAEAHDEKALRSGHLFAACLHMRGDLVRRILGREITRLPDYLEFGGETEGPVCGTGEEMDLSPDLAGLFLEDSAGSPFRFIREYTSYREIGVAEIVVALLMDPSEEICDILMENGFPNDAALLENLVRENFLRNVREFTTLSPHDRLKKAAEMGEKFEKFMCGAMFGQRKAIADVAAYLSDFWCNGNDGAPLVLLLLGKAGGGRSAFAGHMQEAFVELGLQAKVEPPLDLSGFVHDSSCEVDLLGAARSFRNARCGKLYNRMRNNRRGMMVFEDIHCGSRNAKNVLRSFANNLALDKYYEEIMLIPMNVLVLTMKVDDDQYRFIKEKCGKGVTAKLLNELFRDDKNDRTGIGKDWIAAESGGLWERADRIVLLEQMSEEELEALAKDRLHKSARRLEQDYGIAYGCGDETRLIRMIMQSSPEWMGPGDLVEALCNTVGAVWRTINRHREIKRLEVSCAELPKYRYEPARRTIRGDYLVFSRHERLDGEILHLDFDDIRYTRQERVDCGHYRIERPKGTTFDDLVGLEDVRDELLDSLYYITNCDKLAGKVPEPNLNFLLFGPPGTGKSSLSLALANAADVPVFFAASSIFGEPEELSAMFRRAGEMAPAIVVLEEFNSIGNSYNPIKRDAVNELLAILDGVRMKSKLLVIASTNHLEQIEEALLRSGRFGRQIKIGLPNAEARDVYVRRFEEEYGVSLPDEVRRDFVARTYDTNFADLKGMLGYALRNSIRCNRRFDSEALNAAFAKFSKSDRTAGIGFSRGGEQ